MKKINKNQREKLIELKSTIKSFLKFYTYSFITSLLVLKGLDLYKYKDNIYYHEDLKISEDEIKELEDNISDVVGEEISKDDNSFVLGAIIKNPDLDEEEKEIFYEYVDLLDDNPYLIKSTAYNNLYKLDIIYDENAKKDYGEEVMGVYIQGDNEITIMEETEDKDIVRHEIIHCIYSQNYYETLPRFFNEGMTELLTNEYFNEKPFIEETSYPYEITMVKILCELVGSDIVLETYSKEDMTILEKALEEKVGLSNPEEFIKYIDEVMTSLEEAKEIDIELVDDIIGALDKYYKENYDKDSIEYEMYKYNTKILSYLKSEKPYTAYEFSIFLDGYYVKPYFSNKLKEKYKEPFHAVYYQDIESKNDNKKHMKYYKKESI